MSTRVALKAVEGLVEPNGEFRSPCPESEQPRQDEDLEAVELCEGS